jgi:hypothetical protein
MSKQISAFITLLVDLPLHQLEMMDGRSLRPQLLLGWEKRCHQILQKDVDGFYAVSPSLYPTTT